MGAERRADVLPPLLVITGPTAAGKSALALALCRRFPLEIISADAVQVYRGLDIGSAKPDAAERAAAPHHLLDVRDPHETYSAAAFRDDALRLARQITERGRIPALVGGAMFYLHALESGLSAMPAASPELRRRLEAEACAGGWQALHDKLRAVDPAAAARIRPGDRQRIQRALEVHALSGMPLSALQGRRGGAQLPYRVLRLALAPAERAVLHRRIEQRLDAMLAAGLVEETRTLLAAGTPPQAPGLRAVGYAQACAHLRGACSGAELRRTALAATRQLAKRQLGWLRHRGGTAWVNTEVAARAVATAAPYIENALSLQPEQAAQR